MNCFTKILSVKRGCQKNLYTALDDIMSNSSETSEIFQISDEETE